MPFDGTNLTEVQKVLLAAKQLIEEKGWCKKAMYSPSGEHCVAGALDFISDDSTNKFMAEHIFASVIRTNKEIKNQMVPNDHLSKITCWNDFYAREKRDVLAAFDRAIAKAGRE